MKALSIRAPWWWFILHLPAEQWKDVENRDWPKPTPYRGEILIHASEQGSRAEFDDDCQWARKFCRICWFPDYDTIARDGIVGMVKIVDCVRAHTSPWFMGPMGLVLKDPYPLPFRRCPGRLGFFEPEFEAAKKLETPVERCVQTSAMGNPKSEIRNPKVESMEDAWAQL